MKPLERLSRDLDYKITPRVAVAATFAAVILVVIAYVLAVAYFLIGTPA